MISQQAFIGAGANLGDRLAALQGACRRLRETAGIHSVDMSPIYETDPVGVTDQPRFLNAVISAETSLSPEQLLSELQRIENEFGRVRTRHWGPRTLDLDLLVFQDVTCTTPNLTLPHPRMLERAFVTVPLADLLRQPRFADQRWSALRAELQRLPGASQGIGRVAFTTDPQIIGM